MPCARLSPVVEELSVEFKETVKMVTVNTVENLATAGKFGVMAIPQLLFFQGGEVVHRLMGFNEQAVLAQKLKETFLLS